MINDLLQILFYSKTKSFIFLHFILTPFIYFSKEGGPQKTVSHASSHGIKLFYMQPLNVGGLKCVAKSLRDIFRLLYVLRI